MQKNLSIVNQNNKLMLKKSKSLMSITNSVLSNDDWMQRLWDWADQNDISDLELIEEDGYGYLRGIPRDKKELLDLIDLDLSENQLQELAKEIGNFIKLTDLNISENQLLVLPKEVGNLTNLTTIWLYENKLLELPREIGNLTKLKSLMLSNNTLSGLPDEITNLNNLETLSLESNPNLVLTDKQVIWIDSLKMKGCKVTQDEEWMRKLWKWADENDISDLELIEEDDNEYPRGISRNKTRLLNFPVLNLSENQLTELVKEIGNLINVTVLWLDTNQLPGLPKEIGNLTGLTHLWLHENYLSELPKEIGNLLNLKELYLYENELIEFPKEIVNLTNLVEFYFKDNPNLILTAEQKEWIRGLINNGCEVTMDDDLLERDFVNPDFYENKFNYLVIKISNRNEVLGKCFDRNISFVSYVDNKLTWTSTAFDEDKKLLITHWGLINMFVKEIFGLETKIASIAVSIE